MIKKFLKKLVDLELDNNHTLYSALNYDLSLCINREINQIFEVALAHLGELTWELK